VPFRHIIYDGKRPFFEKKMTIETAQEFLKQALSASQNGDSSKALSHFQEAIEASPSWGIPHFLQASELASMGKIDEAETAFSNAALLSPDFPMARYQLGLLQFTGGKITTALISWQPLLNLAESSPLPDFVRGYAELAQNELKAAKIFFQKGLALNTDNPPLNHDIQMVIDGIDGALQETVVSRAKTAAPLKTANETDPADSHVLLTNYRHTGSAN
jgi:tetratricopeptide (TPR) repeat protein